MNKSQTNNDGRSSTGSQYAGFGIKGKQKTMGASSSGWKRDDDEDPLDNILTSMEVKKGIEVNTLQQRPNTSGDAGKKDF